MFYDYKNFQVKHLECKAWVLTGTACLIDGTSCKDFAFQITEQEAESALIDPEDYFLVHFEEQFLTYATLAVLDDSSIEGKSHGRRKTTEIQLCG
jgi:hypothetical protein